MIARLGILAIALGPIGAFGEDGNAGHWWPVYAAIAEDVRMEFADGLAGKLDLVARPALRYANPVRGVDQHGTIHLWTERGRPAVVGSIWSRTSPGREGYRRVNFEWHTLSQRSVRARYDGDTVWETAARGVAWKPLTDVRQPGPTRRIRLLQMRQLAGKFDAEIERGESELRMLPQPLYRYPEAAEGVLDGAMFAYVMGTDPEFFVLIEARPADDDVSAWNVGIVRFTNSALEVEWDEKPWWNCERFRAGPRDEAYFLRFNVRELPADLAGTEFESSNAEDR